MNYSRTIFVVLTAAGLLLAAIAVGCSSKSASTGGSAKTKAGVSDSSSNYSALGKDSIVASGAASGSGSSAGQPAAAPATDAGAANPAQLPDTLGRKIVQSTDIDVKVQEVPRTFQDVVRIATTAGGFVASSSMSNNSDNPVADLTVRVPADQYQSVIGEIRAAGDVVTEKSDANDVTEEYTDLNARLRTLQATEQRYIELLAQAANVTDILTLQDRLDAVRGQIEQVQGRINLLDHLTDLATITVHLRPLGAVGGGGGAHPIEAAQAAWDYSVSAVRGVATAALVVVVFSWWLVPPLIGAAFAARWWLARRPRPAATPTA